MKMRVGMVAIPHIWWPPNEFQHLHLVEFDTKFTKFFFSKNYEVT
jgi:hypothetical protein